MLKITQVLAKDNDILEVHGFDDANPTQEIVATGWQSVMTNYAEEVNGKRTYREMTNQEKQEYWISLLQVQVPQSQPAPQVLFEDSEAQAVLEEAQTSNNESPNI